MADDNTSSLYQDDLKSKPTIRTVTTFVSLEPKDFDVSWGSLFATEDIDAKISKCVTLLREMERALKDDGYTIQTLRIATNPFGEWMIVSNGDDGDGNGDDALGSTKTQKSGDGNRQAKKPKLDQLNRLERLDQLLAQHKIEFCSLGPAATDEEAKLCADIVSQSHRFSCSRMVNAGDVESTNNAAETILTIAHLGEKPNAPKHVQGGLGNFRFCAASYCRSGIPFFPAAKAESNHDRNKNAPLKLKFAIGLENGSVAQELLKDCQSVGNIRTRFRNQFAELLKPIQEKCQSVAKDQNATFLGIDSSLNPSRDEGGSVASAMEQLTEVKIFGGPGTLGAAAEITKALQSLPDIQLTGYCGLMLPVCEDTRLAQLASDDKSRLLRITDILSISSVCGVGVDTVPVPGDCTKEELSSLILDVAGIAGRWNKSLSCRVFPVLGKTAGDFTEFDSPYMVNSKIFSLE